MWKWAIRRGTASTKVPVSCHQHWNWQVVYYMPNEEVLKKGDLSRELCLVLHGACRLMEDEKVKRIVRDDVSPSESYLPPPPASLL
jgi:hypothetical protein